MPSSRTRLILKTAAATLVLAGLASLLAGAALVWSGWYNVGSTSQHFQVVHTVLEKAMHHSVSHHARGIVAPQLGAAHVRRGAAVFIANCQQCHGGPGVSPEDFGKSIQPVPGPLVDAARRWKPNELYWITRHGIKMTGMPGWEFHLSDQDLWSVVAFMQQLPRLTPQDYAAYAALQGEGR
ncbi:c-type cytochrome [Pseudoduganella sp. GCM10020061]|uniref:c-type cytochrome n=1 Tax=Pseudoduganella sp. GCM10020061 TaxID=3317345 RepID=UPI00363F3DEB